MQDIDNCRIRINLPISAACGSYMGAVLYNISEDWRSAFSRKNYKFFGPRAFTPSLVATNTLSFSSYECLKGRVFKDNQTYFGILAFTSGFFAGAVTATPIENYIRLKKRYEIANIQAIYLMMKQGPSCLFVGLREIALREAGFATAMLWAVPKTRKHVFEKTSSSPLAEVSTLGVGLISAILTQPFDKIAEVKQKSDGILSTVDAFKQIVGQNYCPLNLMRGLTRRVVIFTGAIYMIPFVQQIVYHILAKVNPYKSNLLE